MKITEQRLKELLFEELDLMVESGEIDEGILDRLRARASGLGTKIKGGAQDLAARGLSGVARGAGKLGVKGAEKAAGDIDTKREKSVKANKIEVARKKIASIVDRSVDDMIEDLGKLGFNQAVLQKFKDTTAETLKRSLLAKFKQGPK